MEDLPAGATLAGAAFLPGAALLTAAAFFTGAAFLADGAAAAGRVTVGVGRDLVVALATGRGAALDAVLVEAATFAGIVVRAAALGEGFEPDRGAVFALVVGRAAFLMVGAFFDDLATETPTPFMRRGKTSSSSTVGSGCAGSKDPHL